MDIRVITDSRTMFQRMRRVELHKLARKHHIDVPVGAAKDALIPLLESAGINPAEDMEWEENVVNDENGMQTVQRYPKRKPHNTLGKAIDYDSILAQRAQETAERDTLKDENKELRERLARLEAMMSTQAERKPAEMSMPEIRKYAKGKGVKFSPKTKKTELLAALEDLENGEDPA